MARIARKIAGIGASDLPDAAAFDAYVGPSREVTVDYQRGIIALHDGVTPGGQQFHASDVTTIQAYKTQAEAESATVAPAVNTIFVDGVAYERINSSYWNLGPEVLLNPEFTSAANWSLTSGTSISGGKLLRDGNATSSGATSTGVTFITGKAYLLKAVINSISGGSLAFNLQGGTIGVTFNTAGTKEQIQVCGSGFLGLAVFGVGGTVWEIESVSTKQLPDSAFKSADGAWWGPVQAIEGNALSPYDTIADMKVVDTDFKKVGYILDEDRAGPFSFVADDFTDEIDADDYEGIFVKADDAASFAGAFVRNFTGNPKASWFGITPANNASSPARLLSATAAAALLSHNVIELDETITLPSVPDIHALADVTFIGNGKLSGQYKPFMKTVIPRNAGTPNFTFVNDIMPAKQFRRLNAAYKRGENLRVEVGPADSTWTEAPNGDIAHNDLNINALRKWLLEQFPGANLTVVSKAIGGQSFDHWDVVDAGVSGATLTASYPWFTQGETWINQIARPYTDSQPKTHAVVIGFGRNHNSGPDIADLTGLRAALVAKDVDIIWDVAPPPALKKDPGGYQAQWFLNQIATGGLVRSYAQFVGDGFIDRQREYIAQVFGWDVRSSATLRNTITVVPTGTPSSDTVCTEAASSGQVLITYDGTTWNSTAVIQVGIGSGGASGASYLQISKTGGGNLGFQTALVSTGSLTSGLFDSGIPVAAGAGLLVVEWNDGFVTVWDTENAAATAGRPPLFSNRAVVKGGIVNPFVYVRGSGATLELDQVRFRLGEPRKYIPVMTDSQAYTVTAGYLGGNDINHETSLIARVNERVFGSLHAFAATPRYQFYSKHQPTYVPASTVETDAASYTIPGGSFISPGMKADFDGTVTFFANANTKIVRLKIGATTVATYSGAQSGGYVRIEGRLIVDDVTSGVPNWVRVTGEIVTTAGRTSFSTAFQISSPRFVSDEIIKLTMEGSGTASEIALQSFHFIQTQ
jgi:hypothetical protein